jgi:hypothetical protein
MGLLSTLFHASLVLFIDAVLSVEVTYPELDGSEACVVSFNISVWHSPVSTDGKCKLVPCQDSRFLDWDSVYRHPPFIDVPIVDNSMYRLFYNMS